MRINLGKPTEPSVIDIAVTEFKTLMTHHGAKYLESDCDSIDQLEAVFVIPKKYGDCRLVAAINFKYGTVDIKTVDGNYRNLRSWSTGLYPEEIDWLGSTILQAASEWRRFLKKNKLTPIIQKNKNYGIFG